MFYDPKWDRKPQVADLEYCDVTLSGLIAWLRMQPAWRYYDYTDPYNCATAQYKAYLGYERPDVVVHFAHPFAPDSRNWLWRIVAPEPNTFGAALTRALRVQQEGA